MSFEAISRITQAEAEARAAVAAAEQEAKQMLSDAQSAGKASVEAACAKAEGELRQLGRKAEEKLGEDAGDLNRDMENKKAALRARAEARLEKAAALVVERIVNG